MWRHDGINYWEAVSDKRFKGLLAELLDSGVNPASIILSNGGIINWLFPDYHKGCRTLWISNIYDEINGAGNPSDYKAPNVPIIEKSNDMYGYISPDGRYFRCEYGGHSNLARNIVGKINNIDDAVQHLESLGWLAIYKDPLNIGDYSIGMGIGKKMTDEQLKIIQRMDLSKRLRDISSYL